MAWCSSLSNSDKFLVLPCFSFWRSCSVAAAIAWECISNTWSSQSFHQRKILTNHLQRTGRLKSRLSPWAKGLSRVVRQGSRFIVAVQEDFKVVQSAAANTKAVLFTLLFVFFCFVFLRRRRRAPRDLPSARGTCTRPPVLVLPTESSETLVL